jgi:hypothetical protein
MCVCVRVLQYNNKYLRLYASTGTNECLLGNFDSDGNLSGWNGSNKKKKRRKEKKQKLLSFFVVEGGGAREVS